MSIITKNINLLLCSCENVIQFMYSFHMFRLQNKREKIKKIKTGARKIEAVHIFYIKSK